MPDPVPPREPAREQPKVKVETAERPPLRTALQTRLVTPDKPLSPDIQKAMVNFTERQGELWKPYPAGSPEKRRFMNASVNSRQNWAEFRDELGMNTDPEFTPRLVSDEGVITISTDPQTGEVTGFSTALVRDGAVVADYIGIDGREDFRGRGLGIRLVALRNLALARIGIQTYESNLGPESLRMFQKSGLSMEALAEILPEEGEPERFSSGVNHKMTIDMDELTKLCQELGIDPNQDPFATTEEFTL